VLSLSSRYAHFVNGRKLVAVRPDKAAYQFSAGKVTETEESDTFVGSATLPRSPFPPWKTARLDNAHRKSLLKSGFNLFP